MGYIQEKRAIHGETMLYAHSLPGQPPEKWQPLEEHLRNVARLASEFAAPFGSADWAYNAGLLHDLGKASPEFQAYLLRQNELDDSEYDTIGGRGNHSSAGAAMAQQAWKPSGKILAYLAAGHHAGLPDWNTAVTGDAALVKRIEEGDELLPRVNEFSEMIKQQIHLPMCPPAYVAKDAANCHIWLRMVFSCLVDADFLDTEMFMEKREL